MTKVGRRALGGLSLLLAAVVAAALLMPGTLWAQGGGGSGGVYDINAGLSFWTLIVFVALFFLLKKLAWGPILKLVDDREKGIQSAIDKANSANAEAAKLLEQHKAQIADARRQAAELIAEGRIAGDNVRKQIEEKARVEAQAMVERARTEIEREKDAAIDALRKESVDLALAAASRLMQQNLDQTKDRQLVEKYLGELSAKPTGRKGGARA
jgi:F-type H+-transporting ATPase subunit b